MGGKGLGLQVSLAALHHMANSGKEASILETDDFRIPAIKTYLRLGYKPLLIHENQAERWKDLITANDLRIND
jgi:mycothiol synthase